MRLGHLELFCKDCRRTKDFYVSVLGCEEAEVQGGTYIWLRSDDAEILLRPGKPPKPQPTYADSQAALVFYCQDIDELQARLQSSKVTSCGYDLSPECVTFQDPDGRWIQAVES